VVFAAGTLQKTSQFSFLRFKKKKEAAGEGVQRTPRVSASRAGYEINNGSDPALFYEIENYTLYKECFLP
jgi:hypothetical protein